MSDPTTVTVRVTPAVAADLDARDMAGEAAANQARIAQGEMIGEQANPYASIAARINPDGGGTFTFTWAEALELLSDAAWQADPYGPNEYDFGIRQAYALLAKRLRAEGVRP